MHPSKVKAERGRKKEEMSSQKEQLAVSASTPQHLPPNSAVPCTPGIQYHRIHKPFYKNKSPPHALVCLQNL